jgi:glutathione S-transferase
MAANHPTPILFCYDISIYSRKMDYYLGLRGLKYLQCIQPPHVPRPDLQALGINYRKIPILAIGRDIYLDTRIIIETLEKLHPKGALGSKKPFEQGLEHIFEAWVAQAGPFWKTAGCIPLSSPILQDAIWVADRAELTGGKFTKEALVKNRAECLAHLSIYFNMAEHNLLADGRNFIFGTEKPTLGDLHLVFSFDWAVHMQMHAEEENVDVKTINEKKFPRVCAWVERFRKAYKEVAKANGSPGVISSESAIRTILDSRLPEFEDEVIEPDPLCLKKGQIVELGPADFGDSHRDRGTLVALGIREIVIEKAAPTGETLRLHYPRSGFTISTIDQK